MRKLSRCLTRVHTWGSQGSLRSHHVTKSKENISTSSRTGSNASSAQYAVIAITIDMIGFSIVSPGLLSGISARDLDGAHGNKRAWRFGRAPKRETVDHISASQLRPHQHCFMQCTCEHLSCKGPFIALSPCVAFLLESLQTSLPQHVSTPGIAS